MYELIPNELKCLSQWVNFMLVPNEEKGKSDKVPINSKTLRGASSTNPKSWSDFETAVNSIGKKATCRITRNKVSDDYSGVIAGVGIMFGNNVFGVDIDGCIDENGIMSDEANDIIEIMNSYTELSPSKTGIHILAFGKKPEGKCRKGNIEMYDQGRFFTVTGDAI